MAKLSNFFYIGVLNFILILFSALSLFLTPYNNAPDEKTHYQYSVENILKEKKLPVWGVDDADCFKLTISTYNRSPLLNYLIAAGGAFLSEKMGFEGFYGARMVSLVWGIVFINFLFLTLLMVSKSKLVAFLTALICGCIPEVLYVFSYVNSDAHSLAFSTLLGYTTLNFIKNSSFKNLLFFAVSVGLMFSAKYNYFIYFPLLLVIAAYLWHQNILPARVVWQAFLCCAIAAITISSFWYIRNWFLYGSPMPLFIDEEGIRKAGVARLVTSHTGNISLSALLDLHKNAFFQKTFHSFFAMFGYLNVKLSTGIYRILELFVFFLAIYLIVVIAMAKDINIKKAAFAFFAFAFLMLGLHIVASLKYDQQPQGRYLQPLIVPASMFIAFTADKLRKLFPWLIIAFSLVLWLILESMHLIIQTYSDPVSFAAGYLTDATEGKNCSALTYNVARRASKNNYICSIQLPAALNATNICLKFTSPFCARYRDFKVIARTSKGSETLICSAEAKPSFLNEAMWVSNPFAFDTLSTNAFLSIQLPHSLNKISVLTISSTIEYRHKINVPSIVHSVFKKP
jgi:hypothetical protein